MRGLEEGVLSAAIGINDQQCIGASVKEVFKYTCADFVIFAMQLMGDVV